MSSFVSEQTKKELILSSLKRRAPIWLAINKDKILRNLEKWASEDKSETVPPCSTECECDICKLEGHLDPK